MEASAIQAPAELGRTRTSLGASLLRLRSDDQLVVLFRAGHEEAFRAIHDRYKQRLFAYTRQMLSGSRPDAEDALQDIFVRAYVGLRTNDRELTLRAWLYRIAHNRCVDELRRPVPPAPEVLSLLRAPVHDPTVQAEQRESLRRLIEDVRRLPDQQRSALLMRELGGMPYADVAAAIGVSVPAVKSLLVRARIGLAQAAEARDTACVEIHEALVLAHDRGVRPSGRARRHMHDCASCRAFRTQLRGTSRQLAALAPTLGPLGVLAKLLGFGGGATGGAAAAGSSVGAAGATGAAASGGLLAGGIGHVTALLAAAVVTAGGAVELQHTIGAGVSHRGRARAAHTSSSQSVAVAPAVTANTAGSAAATAPNAPPASTAARPGRLSTNSASKTVVRTGRSTSPAQLASGGAASAGAASSGGADATGGSGGSDPSSAPLGATGANGGSGSPSTGTGAGGGSPPTGSGTGTSGTTSSTGGSGSSPTGSPTPGSSGSSPSPSSGSSSGAGTPTPSTPSTGTRLSL